MKNKKRRPKNLVDFQREQAIQHELRDFLACTANRETPGLSQDEQKFLKLCFRSLWVEAYYQGIEDAQ